MKLYRFICVACTLCLLFSGIMPAAAETGIQSAGNAAIVNTQWTSYTNANWINDLAFDADGYLWAATCGGAVRWDVDAGTYVKYTTEHGLCSNQLAAVAVAPDGTIWLASKDNGISTLKDGVFRNYTVGDGLPTNVISDITIAPDGVVWVAADYDICSFDGQRWQTYSDTPIKENETAAEFIVCGPDGSIWFGTRFSGVFKLSDDGWTQYADPEEISGMVKALALAEDGSVWASFLDVDLVRFTGSQAEIIPLDTDSLMSIDCLYVEADGTIWFSDWGDIIRIKDGEWETFAGDYSQNTDTTTIIKGPDGTIWCGGFMGGLAGCKDGEWTVWQTDDWLPDNTVYKVVETDTGGLWILSSTAVTYYDGETAQVYPTNWRALDLLIAPDESVWVSLGNNGVYRFAGSQWTFFGPGDAQDGFVDNSFGAMLDELEMLMGDEFDDVFGDVFSDDWEEMSEDDWGDADDGSVSVLIEPTQMRSGIETNPWYLSMAMTPDGKLLCVSTDETVHCLSDNVWSVYNAQSDSVSDVLISQQGVYWVSCSEGLYRSADGKKWTFYPEIIDPNYFIYHYGSLYVTPDEVCWIASLSGLGCQPADGDSFYFMKGNGIPEENVSCVTGAPDGTIWIGTAYIVSLENGAGAGRYDGSDWQIITASDGLASNAVHDIYADAEHVFFATSGGISVYSPDTAK